MGKSISRGFVGAFDRAKMDADKRTIEISFSSEEPVERMWGVEILDHSKGACDLSRLKASGPVLLQHDRRIQVGVVEDAWPAGNKNRARLRFSKNPLATEIWNDVVDGVRSNVSCTYDILEIQRDGEKDGVTTYRVKRWQPSEISIVSIPADTTVGVGRGVEEDERGTRNAERGTKTAEDKNIMNRKQMIAALNRAKIKFDDNATDDELCELVEQSLKGSRGKATAVAEEDDDDDQQRQPVRITEEDRTRLTNKAQSRERERITSIQSLYHQHRCGEIDKDGKILSGMLEDGTKQLADMQNWILANRYKAEPANLAPEIGMNKKEIKRYSLVRALSLLGSGQPLDGLELEASRAVAKKIRREPEGFFIPHDIASRSLQDAKNLSPAEMVSLAIELGRMQGSRALQTAPASQGGYLVPTNVMDGSLIELLRNKMFVAQLGARQLSGLSGDVAIPRQSSGATAFWLSETGTLTASDQAFGQLALTPHRLGAATGYTKQLLAQGSIDVEAFVRMDLMAVLAIEKDRAAINGLNANGEPLGILNTTGIGSVTFGAAATWQKVIDFETAVANANADSGALAYMTTPSTRGKWKVAVKVTNQAVFLWEAGNIVNGYPAVATLQVPTNRVIFGNWADFIMADWDGMDIVVDPYSLSMQGQIRVVIHLLTDNGLRHVGSMCASTDSGAQ